MKKQTKNNTEKAQRQAKIMGINVSVTSVSGVLASVREKITHNIRFYIVTPNPELVVMAQNNSQLLESLNSADYAIPDGVGLRLAISNLNIIKGRELFLDLIKLANENSWKVFFLGGETNEADLAAQKLKKKYPKVNFESFAGPILNRSAIAVSEVNKRLEKDAVDRINKFKPQMLFVAMVNPKQEIWIHNHLTKLNIGGAMAVGGTFRFISGLSKLPPKWMGNLGLEWVWRLITEPYRFRRIFNAFPLFPLKLFWYKITRG